MNENTLIKNVGALTNSGRLDVEFLYNLILKYEIDIVEVIEYTI